MPLSNEVANSIVKLFDTVSDAELSLADMNWLQKEIQKAVDSAYNEGYRAAKYVDYDNKPCGCEMGAC